MKKDSRSFTTLGLVKIRREAVQRVLINGESPTTVIRSYGLSDGAIYPWLRKVRKEGIEKLEPILRTGRKRKLTLNQEKKVVGWVKNGVPRQYQLDFKLLTFRILTDLILKEINIKLSEKSVRRLLSRHNILIQMPLVRAEGKERDDLKKWLKNDYPKFRRSKKNLGIEVYWLSEVIPSLDDMSTQVNTSKKNHAVETAIVLSNKQGFWFRNFPGHLDSDCLIGILKKFMENRGKSVAIITLHHQMHSWKKVEEYVKSTYKMLELYPFDKAKITSVRSKHQYKKKKRKGN